jgi:hypothetical protein
MTNPKAFYGFQQSRKTREFLSSDWLTTLLLEWRWLYVYEILSDAQEVLPGRNNPVVLLF